MKYLLWLVFFIPAILIELICYVLAPLVAIFITTKPRTDVVKRYNKQIVILDRDYLIKPLYWFQTHDNAVDEWWYGVYNIDHWFKFAQNWTQEDYDSSKFVRYYCRIIWLWRNCAYGFHYNLFSKPKELAPIKSYEHGVEGNGFWYHLKVFNKSFQLEAHIPLSSIEPGNRYCSINIGWKAHKSTSKLLYANRIVGFRKYR